jgi:hypothetical protein
MIAESGGLDEMSVEDSGIPEPWNDWKLGE